MTGLSDIAIAGNTTGLQTLPKLRAVDITPFVHNGQPAIMLRDPLRLSDNYVVLPRSLGPVLLLCDGTHDAAAIRAALLVRYGLPVGVEIVERVIDVLDEAWRLATRRWTEARARGEQAYRQAPFRQPMMAGQSYPADPDQLRDYLNAYLEAAPGVDGLGGAAGRGIASPHIDYTRGGHVYAAVWKRAAVTANEADLVVLLGTDHYGPGDTNERLTLTRQSYATPYGVLPNPVGIVDDLAAVIGEDAAFAGELRNRGEHSLELVAVWLHHMRRGRPVELLPILTGSFGDFVAGQGEPAQDSVLDAFLDTLRQHMAGRRVLVVASGDLSHVGPAFGGLPLDAIDRARIRAADDELIQQMSAGHAEGFFQAIKRERDRNNVCGVSPFYLMMRLLGDAEGVSVAYDQCPADQQNTSLVSVCGMVLG